MSIKEQYRYHDNVRGATNQVSSSQIQIISHFYFIKLYTYTCIYILNVDCSHYRSCIVMIYEDNYV